MVLSWLFQIHVPTTYQGGEGIKRCVGHTKINENYNWKFVKTPGNIMGKSWNFVIVKKWEP